MLARLLLAATVLSLATLPAAAGTVQDNIRATMHYDVTAARLLADCKAQIAIAQRRVNAVLASHAPRTAESTLLPIENITADLSDHTLVDWFMFSVSSDPKIRKASEDCANLENAFNTEFSARPDGYRALQAVASSHTATAPYQTKMLEFYLIGSRRSGAGLNPAARKAFVAMSQELGRLQLRYAANLQNDKAKISITQDQTAGLPDDFIASLKKNDDGSFTVPVNEATYEAFMTNERNGDARKAYYVAFNQRGGKDNVVLLERAIAIRDRLAHLLGYKDWATYQLANKMAQSPQRVETFLADIDTRLLDGSKREFAILAKLKADDVGDASATIEPWDFPFYDNMLRKTKYSVDANVVKQYFPVQHVVDSVLAIYSHMLGVTFKKGADDGWVPAPKLLHYSVYDSATGKFIGDTYFDLYPRPGKYDHFANFGILPNRVLPNGTTRAPMSVIIGNWPEPAPGKPALLSHGDVEVFFHEFGHNMATMLTTAPYESLSGFRQDFVEAPSQMLENFVWQPSILKKISSRWDTGAPLPDDLIAKMIAARYVDQDTQYTKQAFYAMVDMKYHTSGASVDTTKVWATLLPKMTVSHFIPGTLPQAGFGHLMGGYDAGYYGYLWSRVYAQDLFTRFQRQGIQSAAAGHAYRRDILAPAETYEPDQEVRKFLGRPMNPDAFYASLGLKATAQH